jgi:RNA polymerase sigma factor (sigma-70 family)
MCLLLSIVMPNAIARDFFVSYNQHDQPWAEWIAWQVEASGYSVIIQAWDFRPGANFVLAMQSALNGTDRLILVLSNNFLSSDFTQPEWASVFAGDPRGSENRLLPVRVSECKPTGLLKTIVYVDLVGKDENTARADLISGLGRGRVKPPNSPAFPASSQPRFPETAVEEPVERQVPMSDSGRAKFTLVFSGTIDSVDKPTVEAILEHVRKFSRDASITLVETRSGSIRMTFEGSLEGIDRLRQLIDSGKLEEICGFALEGANFEEAKASETRFIESLLSTNMPKLILFARRLLAQGVRRGNLMDHEDLVIEGYLMLRRRRQFWEINWARFLENMSLSMRQVLFDDARAAMARHRGGNVDAVMPSAMDVIATAPSPQVIEELFESLDRLHAESPASADVIRLGYIEGFTTDQIAERLNMPPERVSALRRKGIVFLRKYQSRRPQSSGTK